jgi:hypothetical protein
MAESAKTLPMPVFQEWLRFRARAAFQRCRAWRHMLPTKQDQVNFLDTSAQRAANAN